MNGKHYQQQEDTYCKLKNVKLIRRSDEKEHLTIWGSYNTYKRCEYPLDFTIINNLIYRKLGNITILGGQFTGLLLEPITSLKIYINTSIEARVVRNFTPYYRKRRPIMYTQ